MIVPVVVLALCTALIGLYPEPFAAADPPAPGQRADWSAAAAGAVALSREAPGPGLELHLDRRIAEKRVFPAININRSGTRREDLLMKADDLQKMWILRKILHPMDELAAMEFLFDKLKVTKTNNEFFDAMKR